MSIAKKRTSFALDEITLSRIRRHPVCGTYLKPKLFVELYTVSTKSIKPELYRCGNDCGNIGLRSEFPVPKPRRRRRDYITPRAEPGGYE